MLNWWWLCSQVVMDAVASIITGTPDSDPHINSGASKFGDTDGLTHAGMFKMVDRTGVNWYCANVYNLTQEEVDAYTAKWPNDLEVGGCWDRATGALKTTLSPSLLDHMPRGQYEQVVKLPPQADRQFQ